MQLGNRELNQYWEAKLTAQTKYHLSIFQKA